ncbi:MAG: alpha/beta hydrolase [Bacteroidales bacterium]|nr:alpha/beta hydrolase [Bacteroidales bacterium]
MKRIALFFAAVLISLSAFARNYEYDKEILYKGKPDAYTEKMCRLDVAYEKGAEGRPVIVWFHGGGLTSGWRHIPETLLRDGAVVVGVGYRFVTEVTIPETLDDAAASVAWVLKNIEAYGGDLSKIYLAGHSAGGYIVNMLGLNKEYLAKYDIDPDTQIKALVPYSGQVITHFAQRRKQGLGDLTPTIDHLAPLYHVRGNAAPMLVISGDRELELFGRYEENAYFVRMLRLNGHKNVTFYEVDGFDHGDMAEPAHLLLLKYIRKAE